MDDRFVVRIVEFERLRERPVRERSGGDAEAVSTPIGYLPAPGSLDLDGLHLSQADEELLLTVDTQAWKHEAEGIPAFFRTFGPQLPSRLWELQQDLMDRLG